MKFISGLALAVAIGCLLPLSNGYATFRDKIPNGHNVQHPCDNTKLWQGVGHQSDQGGNERNQFGLDFKAAGYSWTRSLCLKDSDGDGSSNGEELGDPSCAWQQGRTPARNDNITHPGYRTPASQYPYSEGDLTTLNCQTYSKKRCAAFDAPGVRYVDLRVRNGSNDSIVPAKETTYFNMNYELPSDKEYHAVGFAPILDNLNVIHHFVMTACHFPVPIGNGYESFNVLEGCERVMYVWSFGLGPECLPEAAGVPFGKTKGRYVQLQLHWTNREGVSGYRDTSGVRIYYTSKLRKYDIGSLTLGQLDTTIPGGKSSVITPSTCSSDCTKAMLDQGSIYLVTAFPHMHFLGKSMTVDHVNSEGIRTRIMDDKVYNYNSPKVYEYEGTDSIAVKPGDVLHADCEFSSIKRNTTTRWGFGSYDEMCFAFLRYYPNRGELSCLQYQNKDFCYSQSETLGPRCSLFGYTENITVTVNSALRQCSAAIDEVQKDMPVKGAVCTNDCKTQLTRVLSAYRNPCQQTRHKTEWKLLDSLISTKVSQLIEVEKHCQTFGVVNPQLAEGNGAASLAASLLPLLVAVASSASGYMF